MEVKLYTTTEGSGDVSDLTTDELIAYAARVSSTRVDKKKDFEKLLKYLIDNKHWSPFELVDITLEIKAPLYITTQLLRHRSFSFQQYSRRYGSENPVFYVPELRKKAKDNRQGSEELIEGFNGDINNSSHPVRVVLDQIRDTYEWLLEAGVAPECARAILPQCTESTLYMKGSIRSWIHFLQVRLDKHAQKEMQILASDILNILKNESIVFTVLFEEHED